MGNTAASDDELSASELTECTESLDPPSMHLVECKRSTTTEEEEPSKRKRGNNNLWAHARSPKDGEPLRNKHKHEIYYCGLPNCMYRGTPNSNRFRAHLSCKHNIVMKGSPVGALKSANQATINDILGRRAEIQEDWLC